MTNFKSFVNEQEERRKNGVYVSAKLTPATSQKLAKWCVDHLIANPTLPDKYHITVIYSRENVENADELVTAFLKKNKSLKLEPVEYQIFDNKGGPTGTEKQKVLVLELRSPELDALHQEFKKHGATHDFESFRPHVSLSYDIEPGFDVKSIPLPDFDVEVDHVKAEPLNTNWK